MTEHHIYQALGTKNQMLGCDRELFMLNLLVASALIFTALNLVVTVVTLSLALLTFLALQYMGKKDLLLRHVYIRQLRYHSYYLAQGPFMTAVSKQYI